VAAAAATLGLRAVIVMPSDAPTLKRDRTAAAGAEIVTVGPDSDERAARAQAIAEDEGLVPVPPYDHPLVAAGQGTAALEMLEDSGALQTFYAPISGGGLMAGCATVLAAKAPGVEIVGVEPADGADTRISLAAGKRLEVPPPQTIADGLRVRRPGSLTFPVIQRHVSRIETVTDDELCSAMLWALSELRLVLEPSGAAALAVALRERASPCGILLSGGNVDPALLARIIASGAI
jgi:threonine dehydratase